MSDTTRTAIPATCDMCSCYGQTTHATTTRTIRDLGTLAEWLGDVEHPVCDDCAREHDYAVSPRGPLAADGR